MLTIATANVNGIRAAMRRGMAAWLAGRSPDVLCLQEVRAPRAVLTEALTEALTDALTDAPAGALTDAPAGTRAGGPVPAARPGGGWAVVHEEGPAAGRAGVAVACRAEPVAVRAGLFGGRWVEADLATAGGGLLSVVSVYVHTGEAGTPRQEEKYRFLTAIRGRMTELAADGRHVLVCGDLNIAHREADLRNWKGNLGKAGFLPEERAWLDGLYADGWVDVHRRLAGEGPGPYTWWTWRGSAFDRDVGWRIDHQIASAGLAALALKAEVDRAPTYAERWSDHAPVVVTYDL